MCIRDRDHCSWSIAEKVRTRQGWAQRHLLYLGEINDSQKAAWTKVTEVFDPVEVRARTRPVPFDVAIPGPELAAFAAAGVNVSNFQSYLVTHQLALIVSRDVTTRDEADHQQPYNLSVAGTSHQTVSKPGKIYDCLLYTSRCV